MDGWMGGWMDGWVGGWMDDTINMVSNPAKASSYANVSAIARIFPV